MIIRNGMVMDGSGNPWFYADIAVDGDRIVRVGTLTGATAEREIDATGMHITPGFIDIHSHAEGPWGNRNGLRAEHPLMKAGHNLVMQGVTTLVGNHDGRSP